MGRHTAARRAAPRSNSRRFLARASVLVALPVAVGVIALNTDNPAAPRPSANDTGTMVSSPAKGESTSATKTREITGGTSRTLVRLQVPKKVKANADNSKPQPKVPARFVRVISGSTKPTDFKVSSFNVLGYGHTARGGDRRGWADGRTRMGWQVGFLRSNQVSVVGFQEFQTEQYNTFVGLAGGEYSVYPGGPGGRQAVQNSIAWRKADWDVVETHTIQIPYFGGKGMPMPYILLRNKASGREVWFMNFHNPADAHGPAQRWRDAAVSIEIGLVKRLHASGNPVIMTGDFNDREEFMCRVGQAGMHSANGAYWDGSCHLPRPMQVDWITATAEVDFTGYIADKSAAVLRSSDHPMVRSNVTIPASIDPGECVTTTEGKAPGLYCPPT